MQLPNGEPIKMAMPFDAPFQVPPGSLRWPKEKQPRINEAALVCAGAFWDR